MLAVSSVGRLRKNDGRHATRRVSVRPRMVSGSPGANPASRAPISQASNAARRRRLDARENVERADADHAPRKLAGAVKRTCSPGSRSRPPATGMRAAERLDPLEDRARAEAAAAAHRHERELP